MNDAVLNKEKIEKLLKMADQILKTRNLQKEHHRNEFDKFFVCILQKKDIFDTFERRNAGIPDIEWENALNEFYEGLGIK
jgi:hypothetical protein